MGQLPLARRQPALGSPQRRRDLGEGLVEGVGLESRRGPRACPRPIPRRGGRPSRQPCAKPKRVRIDRGVRPEVPLDLCLPKRPRAGADEQVEKVERARPETQLLGPAEERAGGGVENELSKVQAHGTTRGGLALPHGGLRTR